MKYFKFGRCELAVLVCLLLSIGVRLVLIAHNWPPTNSDEATIGLMARHIAYQGEHPIFFYGQYYMGSLEAYLGAASFLSFGSSVFTLRLALLLLFALFLLCSYLLTSLLYSKTWALFVLILLGCGSSFILTRQLTAIGGYPETLLFGSLAFLIASWLGMSYQPNSVSVSVRARRFAAYAAWGLIVGLGLWSDLLMVPFALCSFLLLLLGSGRELLRSLVGLALLLGLLLGAFPLLVYNLHAAPGQDSLTVLLQLHGGGSSHFPLAIALANTLQISIPAMTGSPLCTVPERLATAPASSLTLSCTLFRDVWGLGYLLLFVLASLITLWSFWYTWRRWLTSSSTLPARQAFVRQAAILLLLASAFLSLLIYSLSSSPLGAPGSRARYLIGLLVATPAVLWPLYAGFVSSTRRTLWQLLQKSFCLLALLSILAFFLYGTFSSFTTVPSAQQADQQQQALISYLIRMHDTRIYTDYWTCDRIAFVSNEQIICGVVNWDLSKAVNYNRAASYYALVQAHPHAAYVFPADVYISALQRKNSPLLTHYRRHVLANYAIFQPAGK